jgi:hypothetical protein
MKKSVLIPMVIIASAVILFGIFGWGPLCAFLADWWWYRDVGYLGPWVSRTLYSVLSFALPALLAAVVLIVWGVFARHRRLTVPGILAVAVIAVGAGVWGLLHRDALLLFLSPVSYGYRDPVFGIDAWDWSVRLPVWKDLLAALTSLAGIFLVLEILPRKNPLPLKMPSDGNAPRLRTLQVLLFLAVIAGLLGLYLLDLADIVVRAPHPRAGTGFVETHGVIPGGIVWTALAFAITVFFTFRARKRLTLAGIVLPGLGVAFLYAALVVGFPAFLSAWVLKPNEVALQAPFAARYVTATRAAFRLDFRKLSATNPETASEDATLSRARIWDYDVWLRHARQLQEYRNYFELADSDPDRYFLSNGSPVLTLISVRELADGRLPSDARSWDNLYLRYTHGFGAVVSPASVCDDTGGAVFLLGGLDNHSADPAFRLDEPRIYFGELTSNYALVGTKEQEFDQNGPDGRVECRYSATNGVNLHGFFQRTVFSTFFRERNIALSSAFTTNTRILYRRLVEERIRAIFPQIRWDEDPYPVIADGRVYWVVDGYTLTSRFPLSRRYPTPWGEANCVRSPLRAAVDAYTGETRFALIDETDPFGASWKRLYPGLFRLPFWPSVAAHFRVPYPLARLQARVALAFHVDNPVSFYSSDEAWDFPKRLANGKPVDFDIYYALAGEGDNAELAAVQPFVPEKRDNLAGWLEARGAGKTSLVLRIAGDLPGALGPMQVEAIFNQDEEISKLNTAWNMRGLKVTRGNIQYLPYRGDLLALEPFYLESGDNPIPRLARVAAVWKGRVTVARNLPELVRELEGTNAAVKAEPDIRLFESPVK